MLAIIGRLEDGILVGCTEEEEEKKTEENNSRHDFYSHYFT